MSADPSYARRRELLKADRAANDETWGKLEAPKNVRYVPLDEVLGSMTMRILRAMRFHDWLSPRDVADLIDATEHERLNIFSSNMARLTKEGRIERRELMTLGAQERAVVLTYYRITPAGIAWMKERMLGDTAVCNPRTGELLTPPRPTTDLTMDAIRQLAKQWCPYPASYRNFVNGDTWQPAHELGHALVEPGERRRLIGYGRCEIEACACGAWECLTYEAAAMLISERLLERAGRPDYADLERDSTPGYDPLVTEHMAAGRELLVAKRLIPIPYTITRLRNALRRVGLTERRL